MTKLRPFKVGDRVKLMGHHDVKTRFVGKIIKIANWGLVGIAFLDSTSNFYDEVYITLISRPCPRPSSAKAIESK